MWFCETFRGDMKTPKFEIVTVWQSLLKTAPKCEEDVVFKCIFSDEATLYNAQVSLYLYIDVCMYVTLLFLQVLKEDQSRK